MDNLSLSHGGDLCFASGAWAEGTNANTIKSTVIVPYVIAGRFYSKAITDNIAISYSGPAVYGANTNGAFTGGANGSTRLYAICLDTTGAVSLEVGPVVDTAALAAGAVTLQYPQAPKGKAVTAIMRIAVTAGTTFTPGGTDLSAAGVTATFENVSSIPSSPLTA